MDPYKVLNLSETASIAEIKKRYRELALQFHPDRPGGNDAKFRDIAVAYDSLLHPTKRTICKLDVKDLATYMRFIVELFKKQLSDDEPVQSQNSQNSQEHEKNSQNNETNNQNNQNNQKDEVDKDLVENPFTRYIYKMQVNLDDIHYNYKKSFKVKLKTREVKVSFYSGDVSVIPNDETTFTYYFDNNRTEVLFEVGVAAHLQFRCDTVLESLDLYCNHDINLMEYYYGGTINIPYFGTVLAIEFDPKDAKEGIKEWPGYGLKGDGHLYIHLKLVMPEMIERSLLMNLI